MRQPLVRVLALAAAVGLFSCGGAPDPGFESALVPLVPPRWHGLEGHILIYSLPPEGQIAYFAPRLNINFTEPVYRYDYRTRTLNESDPAAMDELKDWEVPQPAGTVGLGVRFEAKCRTDVQEGIRVQLDSFCIEPEGRNVVAAQQSPSGEHWFVLSAEGEHYVVPENVLGFGPSKLTLLAYGQHHLQLISVAKQDFIGRALPVGIETAGRSFQIDWVDDSHLVIASMVDRREEHWLAVVHVDDFVGAIKTFR